MPEHTYEIFVGVKGDAEQGGVYRYDYDAGANRLKLVKQEARLCGFTHIALSADKKTLAITGKTESGADILRSYRMPEQQEALKFMSETKLNTAGDVCHLSISHDGKVAAVTDFADGAVHFYEMDKDGRIGAFIQRMEFEGSSISYRQDRSHPHSAFFSPDDKRCFVADFGADRVWILNRIDGEKGFEISGSWSAPKGSGPRHIAFHKENGYNYTIMEMSAEIAVWKQQDRNDVEELQVISIANPELPGNYGAVGETGLPKHYIAAGDIVITKDGKLAAASVRGHYEIVILKILQDGRLEIAARIPVRGAVRTIHFNEQGNLLFALGERMGHSTGIMEIFVLQDADPLLFKTVNQIEIPDAFVSSLKEIF